MRINYSTIFLVTILAILIGAYNLYAQDGNTNNRETEWNSFEAKEGIEWNIRWSEGKDVPRTIVGGLTKGYRGTPESIARQFLTEYRSLFSMKEGLTDLRHVKTLTHRGFIM
ncbi:hypothetical protein [Gracilimonas sp.]|uniref:hypothetical protein n=1 Tax=Gracilimonas sp. TaxID=1974203 RepID=UPI002871E9D2|nr:hypothetical protein [Gracilimonas sp.]